MKRKAPEKIDFKSEVIKAYHINPKNKNKNKSGITPRVSRLAGFVVQMVLNLISIVQQLFTNASNCIIQSVCLLCFIKMEGGVIEFPSGKNVLQQ